MSRDIREYFKSIRADSPKLAVQAGTQLARSGINDMDTLCKLLASEPEKIRGIRNIGPKSVAFIRSACAAYSYGRGSNS